MNQTWAWSSNSSLPEKWRYRLDTPQPHSAATRRILNSATPSRTSTVWAHWTKRFFESGRYLLSKAISSLYNKKTLKSEDSSAFCWSCWADSNRRPHPYQGCALPTVPHQHSANCLITIIYKYIFVNCFLFPTGSYHLKYPEVLP